MCSLVAAIGGGLATAPLPSRLSLVYWDGEFSATAPLPSRLSLVYWGGEFATAPLLARRSTPAQLTCRRRLGLEC
jgi:hypothetical protein